MIHGELVTFTDPLRDLLAVDRLEIFRPCELSMYQRVTVASLNGTTGFSVWAYIMYAPQNGARIMSHNQAFFGKFGTIRHKTLDCSNPSM